MKSVDGAIAGAALLLVLMACGTDALNDANSKLSADEAIVKDKELNYSFHISTSFLSQQVFKAMESEKLSFVCYKWGAYEEHLLTQVAELRKLAVLRKNEKPFRKVLREIDALKHMISDNDQLCELEESGDKKSDLYVKPGDLKAFRKLVVEVLHFSFQIYVANFEPQQHANPLPEALTKDERTQVSAPLDQKIVDKLNDR